MARPAGRGIEKQRAAEAELKEAAKTAASRKKGILTALVAVAGVGGVALFIALQPPPPGVLFADLGNQHITLGDAHAGYNSAPPSSGPHTGGLANWGEASEPVPAEIFVHNLEDAGVVLAYDCPDGCEALLADLREVLGDFSGRNVLLTPYEGIRDTSGTARRVAAVAWTRVFYLDSLDAREGRQVRTFINLYEGIDHHK